MDDDFMESIFNNSSENDYSLAGNEKAYALIESRRWDRLKRMIRVGVKEDFSDFDYKDEPLIFDVIRAGAGDVACFWIKHGYPAKSAWGRYSNTVAHVAATCDQPEVLRLLLKLGVDVDKDNRDEETPLCKAAESGCLECVKILLDAGANPDGIESGGEELLARRENSPLAVAKNAEIAKTLLGAGADPNFCVYPTFHSLPPLLNKIFSEEELSPLSSAILDNRTDVAKVLLEAGADPNFLNGQPMRCFAASRGSGGTLKYLLEAGSDINGSDGAEPLRIAALLGDRDMCEKLLAAGALPIPDALRLAVRSGNIRCANLFLKHEIGDSVEAVFEAAKSGNEDMLFFLLGRHPEIGRGMALHAAIEGCDLSFAAKLLKDGVDPDARDKNGATPLARLYSLDRRRKTFRYMRVLDKKEKKGWPRWRDQLPDDDEIDDPDPAKLWRFALKRPDNWNEIIQNFEDDAISLAKELIERGANIRAKDNMGRSVLWQVCKNVWIKSAPWLIEMGASLDDRDTEGLSAFEAGCLSGDSDIIEPMLKNGYDPNTRDANGDTALHKCARDAKENSKYSSAIFWLLRFGADPDLENNKGESLRKLARANEHLAFTLNCAEKYF